jgi:hypothetical protein
LFESLWTLSYGRYLTTAIQETISTFDQIQEGRFRMKKTMQAEELMAVMALSAAGYADAWR